MNESRILFIEDGDITEQLNRLRIVLKKQGLTLIETVFDLNDSKYRTDSADDTGETTLDFDIIKMTLRDNYMNKRFDYVMCDFDFNDALLDGFKLIKWLKNVSESEKMKIRRAKFSLYSSEQEKFLNKILTEDEISNLIKLKLEDFYARTRIAEDFGSDILKTKNDIDLKDKLISELDRYKELKFKSVYPKFKGKTLDEIASEIEKDTHHGIGFQKELIELSITHLIDLNKE